MTTPKHLTDAQILAALEQDVADGNLHESNLAHWRGADRGRNRVGAAGFTALAWVARTLPVSLGYGVFSRGLLALGAWVPWVRTAVEARLALAFPEATARQLRVHRRAFCRQFGKTVFEVLDHERFNHGVPDRVHVEGAQNLHAALAAGKPLVLIAAHQANWELLWRVLESLSDRSLCGIYSPLAIPSIHRRLLYRRTRRGTRIYPRSFRLAAGKALKDLQAGHPFVVALDQRMGATQVPFFGRQARSTLVPLKLAQRVGAHILPLDLRREEDPGQFRLTVHANIGPNLPGELWDLEAILIRYHALLEGWIRERPEDWFWLHDRWRE